MNVWIVSHGMLSSGGHVVAVCKTQKHATALALMRPTWKTTGEWELFANGEDCKLWRDGYAWVDIQRMRVRA